MGGINQGKIYREVGFGLSFEVDRDRPSPSGKGKPIFMVKKEFLRDIDHSRKHRQMFVPLGKYLLPCVPYLAKTKPVYKMQEYVEISMP